jgi:hypothetical protein
MKAAKLSYKINLEVKVKDMKDFTKFDCGRVIIATHFHVITHGN